MATAESERLFAEGVALHKQGRVAEAGAAYAHACEADPSHLAARFNLAVALHGEGRHLEAETAYKKALALKPDLVQALNNLGNLYLSHNRVAEALDVLMRASRVAPAFAPPWNNLGNALLRMGRTEEAREHFAKALGLDAHFLEARENLGRTLLTLGRAAEALPHLDEVLRAHPADAALRFLREVAAGAKPARPPDAFVASLFDDMAADFDQHLVERLGYRSPDHIAQAVGEWLDARPRPRRVLDLGCGTGLVADALRGRFEEMHGVDLSPRMVEKARARRLYASLEAGELVAFLGGRAGSSADLVVAADVFVFVGDLSAVFAQAARVVVPGGLFAFTVEGGGPGEGFELPTTGRYVHGAGCVAALAQTSGFRIASSVAENLRAERGRSVAGRIFTLAR